MLLFLALAACAGAPPESTAQARPGFDHKHAAFAGVLKGAVTADGRVRYGLLRGRQAALDAYVASLAEADVGAMSRGQKLAFWVNAYNASTLSLIVSNPGIKSIKELDGGDPWKARTFRIGGEDVTLDQMENAKARPLSDGRVHAVVNCASVGCPPLPPEPLTAVGLEAQLDEAARTWVATNAYVERDGQLLLSNIFKWYAGDFAVYRKDAIPGANEAQTRALWFIARFGGPDRTRGGTSLGWNPYDWSLNDAG